MKTLCRLLLVLSSCVMLLSPLRAAESPVASDTGTKDTGTKDTPGIAAAEAISTITGVAISPLLGVSGVGAYKWYKTPPEKRAKLPWFAQPWFWGPALLLVALALVKDTFGTALPTAVKKPFDVVEAIENKISGLVAAGAFVPLIAIIFKSAGDDGAWLQDTGLAVVDMTPWLNILTVPLAVVAFLVVFLVSHVINVFILISPFTVVDTALKGMRTALLSTVALTAFVNPYVGAVWSLCIIAVCFFLSGWAFRLFVFGTIFTWDLGTFRKTRFKVEPEANWVFTARALGQTPIRTYGKLTRGLEGELVLTYRPWLVLPRRTLVFPAGQYAVGRGLFYSEIITFRGEEDAAILTLAPCYRSHEGTLASLYMLGGVHDTGMVKGMKTLWNWLKELFGFRPEAAVAA